MTVYSKNSGDIRLTYENILTDNFIRSSLESHYRYEVMSMIKGIPLGSEYSMSIDINEPEGFGKWLWMMYGHMSPTQEEIIHMWLDLAGIIPIAGTIAEAYNTFLYYIEGDIVSALIYAGVVVFSAVGDYLLIKNIASEVRFSFSSDVAVSLATVSDDVVDAATKQSIIRYLDDVEGAGNGLVKEGLGKILGKTYQVTQSNIDSITRHLSGDLYAEENVAMINRLQNALNSGKSITGADASFYFHELKEIELMQGGMIQTAAHDAAIDFYQVSKYSTYHPDVIKAYSGWFNDAWFNFWGITR